MQGTSTVSGKLAGALASAAAILSNRNPAIRRFAPTVLRGTLPSGWDAALYRNGRQLEAFQVVRRTTLRVEVTLFGPNELEVICTAEGQIDARDNRFRSDKALVTRQGEYGPE